MPTSAQEPLAAASDGLHPQGSPGGGLGKEQMWWSERAIPDHLSGGLLKGAAQKTPLNPLLRPPVTGCSPTRAGAHSPEGSVRPLLRFPAPLPQPPRSSSQSAHHGSAPRLLQGPGAHTGLPWKPVPVPAGRQEERRRVRGVRDPCVRARFMLCPLHQPRGPEHAPSAPQGPPSPPQDRARTPGFPSTAWVRWDAGTSQCVAGVE